MLLRFRYINDHSKTTIQRVSDILTTSRCFVGGSGPTCFLAVCGNSGCGKTSTVQQVCAEYNVHILEWSDDLWDAETGSTIQWGDDSDRIGASSGSYVNSNYSKSYEAQYGGGYSHTAQDLFKVEGVTWAAYTSKVQSIHVCMYVIRRFYTVTPRGFIALYFDCAVKLTSLLKNTSLFTHFFPSLI